jgi:hypothetical protein
MCGDVEMERFSLNPDLKCNGKGTRLVDFLNPPTLQWDGNFL